MYFYLKKIEILFHFHTVLYILETFIQRNFKIMSAFAVNNIPDSNVVVRRCSHCRLPGHKVNVCREAFIDGNTHHEFLLEIIYAHLNSDNLDATPIIVKSYLRNLTLAQLKLITYIHEDINIFSYQLFHQNLITFDQAAMLLKVDIITVLGYYYQSYYRNLEVEGYLQSTPPPSVRKIEIESIQVIPCKETKFQCPICIEQVNDTSRITTNCGHDVCTTCFDNYLSSLQNAASAKIPSCCLCRANITTLTFTSADCCNDIKKYLKCKIV